MRFGPMNLLRFCRSLHQTCGTLNQGKNAKLKSAKEVVKLISSSGRPNIRDDSTKKDVPTWQKQELALKRKFKGERWNPSKRLSREEMESMRLLKHQFPKMTATDLSERYKVSPEAIRRVLKSKWQPTEQESIRVHERWKRRGERIKELYESDPESMPAQNILVPRKISISSARNSTDFVLRNTKYRAPAKTTPKNDKTAGRSKSKLFLLKGRSQDT